MCRPRKSNGTPWVRTRRTHPSPKPAPGSHPPPATTGSAVPTKPPAKAATRATAAVFEPRTPSIYRWSVIGFDVHPVGGTELVALEVGVHGGEGIVAAKGSGKELDLRDQRLTGGIRRDVLELHRAVVLHLVVL